MKTDNLNEYEANIVDLDEIQGTDIKINPNFYLHTALLKAQQALVKDDVEQGFLQYWQIAEHVEVLCRSAKLLDDEYDSTMKKFRKETLKDKTKIELKDNVKIAHKKIELLTAKIFDNKVITEPGKL